MSSTTKNDIAIDAPHLRNLQEFIDDLNQSTANILSAQKQRYKKVTALVDALSDRKHIRASAKELCKEFKDTFKFDVNEKPFLIHSLQSRTYPALRSGSQPHSS